MRTAARLASFVAALGAAAVLGAAAANTPSAAAPAGSTLRFTPCRIEHPTGLAAFAAECARIRVPENPARPAGRQIELAITRVPAISRRKAPDPLFLIAGGPGMGSAAMYPSVAAAFARVGRDRDLVLVDQRGTGDSTPLRCDIDDEDMLEFDAAALDAETRRCLAALQQTHDVAQFTTSVAVGDLERVRAAMGYTALNLYGVSYGSRVAQHYLRRHPDRVRSVILDGVVPPGLALGPGIALDAEAALQAILGRCAADADCRSAFGDPADHYRRLRAELAASPRDVTLADPRTGQPRNLRFGPPQLAVSLRLSSYAASQAALLPYALHAAAVDRNFTPLGGLFLMSAEGVREAIAFGMHNSVVCAEDMPRIRDADLDRGRLAATYLGTDMIDALRSVCAVWPRGPVDADFNAPLSSDTPVLLLSGSADPVTPPANAEAAMRGLRNARHLVLPNEGHGQVGVYCIDRVFADFLREPAPAALDTRCLERRRTQPFFVGAGGPAP
jgi:pimeloyl-ACP methyl ester carboxylesterase